MDAFVGPVLDRATSEQVETHVGRYLAGRHALLHARMRAGEIVDGHGDLLADDIFCLDDGPRILDCLEFSEDLRHGDVLADVGFLAMDLERLGRPDLGERLLHWYREFTAESFPASLAHHYIAYRAHVRSKVACLRHAEGAAGAADEARQLLDLSLRHLRRARVVLVLIGGLPGTGKSTVSATLSDHLSIPVLRSDEARKELAGIAPLTGAAAPYGQGIYGASSTAATYELLLRRARESLELGQSVVIDASFTDHRWRDEAWLVAEQTASDLVAVQCVAPPDVAGARLRARAPGSDPSDATPEIAARMAADADPWPEATTVVTAGSPEAAAGRVVALLGALP
jgi:predicted kinase